MPSLECKPLFMVLDPEGTIVRIVDDESKFDEVRLIHAVERLRREIPRGMADESRARLAAFRAEERCDRAYLVCQVERPQKFAHGVALPWWQSGSVWE